ncbi:hypothetical protein BDW69DRAFT_171736 [Aspergillus filifer]
MARQTPVPITYIGREENLEELEDREAQERQWQRTSREESPTRIFTAEEELADLGAGRRPPRGDNCRRSRSRSRSKAGSKSNSRIRLRARRDSRSISPVYRRRYRSSTPPRLDCFTSHSDLFSTLAAELEDKDGIQGRDRYILLTPFMRETYITTHPATNLDFSTWLPLLALGVPETWYAFGISEQSIQMSSKQPLLAPRGVSLLPQKEPRPVGLRVPRIVAGAALLPPLSGLSTVKKDLFDDIPGPVKDEDGTAINPPSTEKNLIYLSIQSTISGVGTHRPDRFTYSSPDRSGLPDLAGSSTTGQNIYRVVKTGSREEAAAQAFYAAGGNRWSTPFTCVVVDEGRLSGRVLVCDEDVYTRVGNLEELVEVGGESEQEGKRGRMKVFY